MCLINVGASRRWEGRNRQREGRRKGKYRKRQCVLGRREECRTTFLQHLRQAHHTCFFFFFRDVLLPRLFFLLFGEKPTIPSDPVHHRLHDAAVRNVPSVMHTFIPCETGMSPSTRAWGSVLLKVGVFRCLGPGTPPPPPIIMRISINLKRDNSKTVVVLCAGINGNNKTIFHPGFI